MNWLRKIRGSKSQQTIANELGIAQSTYASIELGRRKPSVAMAKKIAAVLGFDWTRFYDESGAEEPSAPVASGQDSA